MAKAEATLIVRLIDNVTAGLKNVKSAITSLRNHWLTVTAALAGVTAIVVSSINAFSDQENAVNKLNVALKNQGIFSKAASEDLVKFAESLSKTSLFADETIIEMQALLTTFGLAGTPLKNTTKAALDLATGLGVDLRTATLILGKAAAGETGTLSRYGIKISESIPPSQKLAAIIDVIASRFGGTAQAATTTFSGKIEVLKIRFGELSEKLGSFLIGPADRLLDWGGDLVTVLEFISEKWQSFFGGDLERKRKRLVEITESLRSIGNSAFLAGITSSEKLNKLLEEQKRLVSEIKSLEDKARKPEIRGALPPDRAGIPEVGEAHAKELEKINELALTKIDTMTRTNQEIEEKEVEHLTAMLIARGNYELAIDLMRAAAHQKEMQMKEKARAAGMKALSDLASLSNSKNKEISAVAKAAAITQATVETYVGAQKSYNALAEIPYVGPALGAAAAAAAIAAGLGRVASIQGTPLAHGGMVLPTLGGTLATIGEAGRSEAVIPLGDERAKREIRETLGGGGDTIVNLHVAEGGVFVGDNRGIQELTRMVSDELFRLDRNGKSNL